MTSARKLTAPADADRVATVERVRARLRRIWAALDTMRDNAAAAELRLALDDVGGLAILRVEPLGSSHLGLAWMVRAKGGTLSHAFLSDSGELHLRSECGLVSRRGEAWSPAGAESQRCLHCKRGRS